MRRATTRQTTELGTREETRAEIVRLSDRYTRLFADIRTDLDDLREQGRMRRAAALSEATGEQLSDTDDPMYFTGDLDAPFALVHLNPKQTEQAGPGAGGPRDQTLDEYYAAHRYFGARHYGPDATFRHISPFATFRRSTTSRSDSSAPLV